MNEWMNEEVKEHLERSLTVEQMAEIDKSYQNNLRGQKIMAAAFRKGFDSKFKTDPTKSWKDQVVEEMLENQRRSL